MPKKSSTPVLDRARRKASKPKARRVFGAPLNKAKKKTLKAMEDSSTPVLDKALRGAGRKKEASAFKALVKSYKDSGMSHKNAVAEASKNY